MTESSETAPLTAATCPAAHSMDTNWFAVDQDGYVAMFTTGEGGALPTEAGATPEGGDLDALPLYTVLAARALAAGKFWESTYDSDALEGGPGLALVDLAGGDGPETYRDDGEGPLAELASIGEVLVEGPTTVVHVEDGAALAELGNVRIERWVSIDEVYDWSWEEPKGLFVYQHADWNVPGAYARGDGPDDPIALDDVPESIRDAVGQLVLDVPFAETAELQLADHLSDDEAVSWANLALDGSPMGPPSTGNTPQDATERAKTLLGALVLCAIVGVLWWWLH